MGFITRLVGNLYMFIVFPFTELFSAFTKRGSCGIGALATCAAVIGVGLMGLGALGGWALGLPPYLTCFTIPVVISVIGAATSKTTL